MSVTEVLIEVQSLTQKYKGDFFFQKSFSQKLKCYTLNKICDIPTQTTIDSAYSKLVTL